MKFNRELYKNLKGDDVFYIKNKLFLLNYYAINITKILSYTYGSDTVYAVTNFQKKNNLEVTGKIDQISWDLIEQLYEERGGNMVFTKTLSKGSNGEDVYYIKKILFDRGYYSPKITVINSKTYGSDTVTAVKLYQTTNKITITGNIDKITWNSIINSNEKYTIPDYDITITIPKNISTKAATVILTDLKKVNTIRQKAVAEILKYAVDLNSLPTYMISFYIRGGNLYNKDLTVNTMTLLKLNKYFNNNSYAEFFDGGRKEIMLKAAQVANYTLSGADCSGGIVGILRWLKVVSSSFDVNANTFCGNSHSTAITKTELLPGDWVGREGHIGMYVGGGYVVEWVGGAYGCQLTVLSNRYVYNFLTKKKQKFSAWTKYRRPKYY